MDIENMIFTKIKYVLNKHGAWIPKEKISVYAEEEQ